MSEELEEKPARKPRTRKAKEQDASPEAKGVAVSVEEAAPAEPKKPARRTTRKPKEAPEANTAEKDAATEPASVSEAVAASAADAEAPAAKKPARKTSRKAAAKPKSEAADTEVAVTEALVAEKPEQAAQASADVAPAAPAQEQAANVGEEAQTSEEKKKPARRRTHKNAEKAADAAELATQQAPEEATAPAAETEPASKQVTEAAPAQTEAAAAPAQAEAATETVSDEAEQAPASAPQTQKNEKKNKQNQQNNRDRQKNNRDDHRRQRRSHQQQIKEVLPSISKEELSEMKVGDLREKAAEYSIDASGLRKSELIEVVFDAICKSEGILEIHGILDIMSDGYGFMRTRGYLPSEFDAYVSLSIIRRNGLRKGDYIVGQTRPARDNEKYAAIQKIISINGVPAEEVIARPRFADLTPIYPDERLVMEHGKSATTARIIDLISPIGKGQRGLFVSPPKAGKTTVLKDVAAAISANNPEVHLMCLLVDERPEEVTDMERSIHGEVISSTFDMPCENHIAVAELVIERAKRLVEQGKDVVILLDSITRLARAYNMAQPASGRVLSGGVDSSALYPPKRFLGAARNIENGGSLTILGTALIDTGSKMDEVIFEEFKGTGNMELKLDRNLADRRIYPAIDVVASGTRKEELLMDPQEAPLIWAVRRVLSNMNNTERATDTLIKSLKQTDNNQEFLIRFAKKAQGSSLNGSDSVSL